MWEGTDARPEVERFREIWGIECTILLDETGDYARRLGIRGVPTNVLVDGEGTVHAVGVSRLEELDRAIATMLAQP